VTKTRYHRHNLIDWFSQDALAESKIAVVGAGAVGNEMIKNLALLGVGEIHIFDLDKIEEHNLTRSVLFRSSDIGESKATVAAKRAMDLDPNILAVPYHGDFWTLVSLSDLRSFDVLFCCVDNFEARIHCNTMCYLAGVDFVNTGIDSRSAVIEFYPFSQSRDAGCLECNMPPSLYQRIAQRYSCGHLRKVSFVERRIPTTIVTSTVVASLAVSRGLRFGEGGGQAVAQRFYVDTIAGSLTRTDLARTEACSCCGRFTQPPHILPANRDIGGLAEFEGDDVTVVCSEPVLVSYSIAPQNEEHIVFERASSFTSDYPVSLADDPGAVSLEIRDQFTLGEVARRFFAGRSMPCKFAVVLGQGATLVFEFEGDSHERREGNHPNSRPNSQG
jgi:molybdopterin/thiamine biosynthesis adenylyltransferase